MSGLPKRVRRIISDHAVGIEIGGLFMAAVFGLIFLLEEVL